MGVGRSTITLPVPQLITDDASTLLTSYTLKSHRAQEE